MILKGGINMKIQTIKDRIKKAESRLEKSNGTLERHKKQLEKKKDLVVGQGVNLDQYDKYDRTAISSDLYWDLCDYESKLRDIENTENKITETTETLEKLNNQLKDQIAKDDSINDLIPECLNVFLENWKQRAIKFYTNLANEFIAIKNKEYEITKEELELLETTQYDPEHRVNIKVRKYTDDDINKILAGEWPSYKLERIPSDINWRYREKFKGRHFASDLMILDKILNHYDVINTKLLNKILDEDVKIKKEMFVTRINQVIGTIKDLSGLSVGNNGEINGIAIGLKCNAKVETITAGGYNIQVEHYRVLVNSIK
jgi:hypothetical protein